MVDPKASKQVPPEQLEGEGGGEEGQGDDDNEGADAEDGDADSPLTSWQVQLTVHTCTIHKTNTDACSFTGGRLVCRGSMIHFSMIVSMVFLKCA